MTIKKNVDNILKKYYFDEKFHYFRYEDLKDEKEKEYNIQKELKNFFKENNISYKLSYVEGLESHKLTVDFLSIAWIDENDKLNLKTILIEN